MLAPLACDPKASWERLSLTIPDFLGDNRGRTFPHDQPPLRIRTTMNRFSADDPFTLSNDDIALFLEQVADLLEVQQANPYRIRAYREGGRILRSLSQPAAQLFQEEGRSGLEKWPGVGKSLSAAIAEILQTGRLQLLERLLGESPPESLFSTIPGIGEELAHRLHEELGLETLEDLELAAHDGRLATVKGFGKRRIRLLREVLATRLGQTTGLRAHLARWRLQTSWSTARHPTVAVLLDVDADYRRLATAHELPTLAPRRFNPDNQCWLPILHCDRAGWFFTALYSNTARAHALGKTHDWVILYYDRDGQPGQCTVVTEIHGALRGKRVIRGRETECAKFYTPSPSAREDVSPAKEVVLHP
jgi:DNA polymerase (family X)